MSIKASFLRSIPPSLLTTLILPHTAAARGPSVSLFFFNCGSFFALLRDLKHRSIFCYTAYLALHILYACSVCAVILGKLPFPSEAGYKYIQLWGHSHSEVTKLKIAPFIVKCFDLSQWLATLIIIHFMFNLIQNKFGVETTIRLSDCHVHFVMGPTNCTVLVWRPDRHADLTH